MALEIASVAREIDEVAGELKQKAGRKGHPPEDLLGDGIEADDAGKFM